MKRSARTAVVAEGLALVVVATMIWSAVPVCVKVILRSLDPYTIAWLRFALATATLLPVLWWSAPRRLDRAERLWIVLGGAGMMGNYTLYNVGLQHTTASAANLMVQIEMVVLVFLCRLVLRESLGWWKVAGMAMTVMGITVVFAGRGALETAARAEYLAGNAIVLAAGVSWSFYGLSQKALANRGAPVAQALVGIFGVAALFSLGPTLAFHETRGPVTPLVVVCIVIIGALSTGVGYLLLGRAFRLLDATTVGAASSMLPIFTIVSARIFLHEWLTVSLLVGALLVVAGILTIARQDTARSLSVEC